MRAMPHIIPVLAFLMNNHFGELVEASGAALPDIATNVHKEPFVATQGATFPAGKRF